jgi:Mce-associated membrane protein
MTLILVAVGLAVSVGLLFLRGHHDTETARARTAGLAAAKALTPRVLSYGYQHMDADVARAEAGTTGRFRSEYTALVSQVIKPLATSQSVLADARVVGASVIDAATNHVVALLYVDETSTSKASTTPQLANVRVRATLVPVNGKWLLSDLQPV